MGNGWTEKHDDQGFFRDLLKNPLENPWTKTPQGTVSRGRGEGFSLSKGKSGLQGDRKRRLRRGTSSESSLSVVFL
jgi:hypothetical protein